MTPPDLLPACVRAVEEAFPEARVVPISRDHGYSLGVGIEWPNGWRHAVQVAKGEDNTATPAIIVSAIRIWHDAKTAHAERIRQGVG